MHLTFWYDVPDVAIKVFLFVNAMGPVFVPNLFSMGTKRGGDRKMQPNAY